MKANVPEKIYIFENPILDFTKLSVKQNDDDIEYVRKDAFVEKVARFLEYKLNDRVEIQVWGTLIPSLTSKKAFIDEFRKYMKGE